MANSGPASTYRAPWLDFWFVTTAWVVVVGIVASVSRGQGLGAVIFNVALASLPFVYFEYWFAFRFARTLELWPDRIRWRSVLRSGEVPLAEVLAFRAPRWGFDFLSIRTRRSGRIYLARGKGVVEFANRTQEIAPKVEVDPSWMDLRRERGGGQSRTS